MTTMTAPTVARPQVAAKPHVGAVTPIRVLNSEWIKMRSLGSTAGTLLAGGALTVGRGWLAGWATNANWSDLRPDEQASFSPIDTVLAGFYLAQLAIGVLGVLLVTGEYATGMVRATFGAVPQRLPVPWAKAAPHARGTSAPLLPRAPVAFP